jgi:LEA14-like dessication related protein
MIKKAFFLLFLLSLGLVLSSCVQPSAPEVKYVDYKLGRITPEGLEVNFNFEVNNPNPIPLDVSNYSYKVFINDKELVAADHQGFSLAASAKTRVSIQTVVRYDQIFGAAASLLANMAKGVNSFDYRVEGNLSAGILGITVSAPLKASGTIPIPKEMKII